MFKVIHAKIYTSAAIIAISAIMNIMSINYIFIDKSWTNDNKFIFYFLSFFILAITSIVGSAKLILNHFSLLWVRNGYFKTPYYRKSLHISEIDKVNFKKGIGLVGFYFDTMIISLQSGNNISIPLFLSSDKEEEILERLKNLRERN